MKTISRIIFILLLGTSSNSVTPDGRIPRSVVNHAERATQETIIAQPTATASLMDDMKIILQGKAAETAYTSVKSMALSRLRAQNAVRPFIMFLALNQDIFAKWPEVCSDFMRELTQTMPVEVILANLGITTNTLHPAAIQHIQDTAEEDAEKDRHITQILKNSPSALINLVSLGIGYVSSYIWSKCKRGASPVKETSTEELLQGALRKSLKKNYTVAQLSALNSFSGTPAYKILVTNFDDLKKEFLTKLCLQDPTLPALLEKHLVAMAAQPSQDEEEEEETNPCASASASAAIEALIFNNGADAA